MPALAQQVRATVGQTVVASGVIDTGTTTAPAGYALYASGGGVIESSSPLVLKTGASGVHAARAEAGGMIDIFAGSTITTTGALASGLYADGVGSLITATGAEIAVGRAQAVEAYNGGRISLTGGSIVTSGQEAHGLFAFLGGASIEATNLAISL